MKACRQRNSGIGGQAVLEGVMMRNGDEYAIAVRKSDGSIVLKKETYRGFFGDSPLKKIPFVRGVFVFIDSMILGLKCTDYSASIYAEDDPDEAGRKTEAVEAGAAGGSGEAAEAAAAGVSGDQAKTDGAFVENVKAAEADVSGDQAKTDGAFVEKAKAAEAEVSGDSGIREAEDGAAVHEDRESPQESLGERILMGGVMAVSLVLALGLFMALPVYLASHVVRFLGNAALLSLFEGVIRIAIFVLYIVLISQMKDIRRLFMYHGAEHKCINCIESGQALTVENAARATRLHKRCGSSFILFVMLVSIILFFFIRVRHPVARVGLRILLLPVISGISYELIRFAGSSDNPVIAVLSRPGLWLQGLTTKEPDEEMLAVAIESVEAVFDWRSYLEETAGA